MAAAKNFISEDDIEQALLQRLKHLCGFDALNCFTAQADDLNDGSGRADKRRSSWSTACALRWSG